MKSRLNDEARFRAKSVVRPRVQVEGQLSNAITSGELVAGTRLPSEIELAKDFGVSRNTVREALRALEQRGLISTRPGARGGSFIQIAGGQAVDEELQVLMERLIDVRNVTYEELVDIRRFLEGPAVRLACVYRTEEQLAKMQKIVEDEALDPARAILDSRTRNLHTMIGEASGNKMLSALIGALHRQTTRIMHLPVETRGQHAGALEQHAQIVAAIAARDAVEAERALMHHLDTLRDNMAAPWSGPLRGDRLMKGR